LAWEALPPMSTPRRGGVIVVVGGQLYVCGGWSDNSDAGFKLASVERFDPAVGMWETMPSMHARRAEEFAVLEFEGLIYAFGCGTKDGDLLFCVERFDIQQACWEELPPPSQSRCEFAWDVCGENLYICGGHDSHTDDAATLNSVERLNLATGSWQTMPSMLKPRYGASACVVEGRLYVCGGAADVDFLGYSSTNSVECFDPLLNCWKILPPMQEARDFAMVAGMPPSTSWHAS